ncbi:glycoside hydrolase family 15 protein [Pyxidicoccus fallax]|uniref:Trehalase n=1 Tax=Pyxidicoccus fallax TaxID=394095 RepID=A0A848LD95_9BACT|nr:glycoside hydrolase family 15 protein [Pyxidicoccus fallax]NMO13398.1 glycoside hydrolase family 15 protein [Pyxidicoccus fallax]NPC80307.1 glycoside hydrolase family 15 protein [Pyxidicoccus fallax]
MEGPQTTEAPRPAPDRAAAPPTQPRIEDHALLGDMNSAALVTRDGEIDWLCLPAFDSDACFAALLGTAENGRWKIGPSEQVRQVRRRYRGDTMILETDFQTDSGTLRLIDFMVPGQSPPQLVRTLQALDGSVPVHVDFVPRLAFGHAVPSIERKKDFTVALAGPDALYLYGGPTAGGPEPVADFTLSQGDKVSYVLTWGRSFEPAPKAIDPAVAERETERYWTDWAARIQAPKNHRDAVVRSLLTLKACTYAPTGGIVAAPTTSLPETPGGVRNWDYRFTWLRDSALAVRALVNAGLADEAIAFRDWMLRAIAGDPSQIQIMYGIRGERRLTEAELSWLPGYGGARPVRVGNGAFDQFQLDVFGEVASVINFSQRKFGKMGPMGNKSLLGIANFVAEHWRDPDRGIWEMRGPERSFTASKVSAWAAIDAAIRASEMAGEDYPLDKLRAVRDEIFKEVCEKGFNAEKNTFTQYYGGTDLDASLLAIPLTRFLPATDPRVVGTVAALERELMEDGFLLRFRPVADVDGLSGDEGAFLACSFWLADTYQLMGRTDDARKLFERLVGLSNDVGLLAEEWDPVGRRQLGNFPQAFTHFALVNAAYVLEGADPDFPSSTAVH